MTLKSTIKDVKDFLNYRCILFRDWTVCYLLDIRDELSKMEYGPNWMFFLGHLWCLPLLLYFNFVWLLVYPILHFFTARKEEEKVKTPDERFDNLFAFPYKPNYLDMTFPEVSMDTLKVHYVDEGDANAKTVLLLHGSHTWSYLYRRMISKFRHEKYRVIALDFVGSGKSDKLCSPDQYSYGLHVQTVSNLIEDLDLKELHVCGFEWGSTVALSVAMKYPDLISGLFLMRAKIPVGVLNDGLGGDGVHVMLYKRIKNLIPALNWRLATNLLGRYVPLEMYFLFNEYVVLRNEIRQSYNAPYPSKEYKGALAKWPKLVPFYDDDTLVPEMEDLVVKLKDTWTKPLVLIHSRMDRRVENESWRLAKIKPDCIVITMKSPSNFLPETHGPELAKFMSEMIASNYDHIEKSTVPRAVMSRITIRPSGRLILDRYRKKRRGKVGFREPRPSECEEEDEDKVDNGNNDNNDNNDNSGNSDNNDWLVKDDEIETSVEVQES